MSCNCLREAPGKVRAHGPVGASPGRHRGWRAVRLLGLLVCITGLPQLAQAKKPYGSIINEHALENVRSYCFDTTGLSDQDAYLVRGFVRNEDKPKHLLTKLPWKLNVSCQKGNPDAVVKVNFESVKIYGVTFGANTPTPMTRGESTRYQPKAVLEAVEKNSNQIIYKAHASPLANTSSNSSMPAPDNVTALRLQALRNVVATLVHDVRIVSNHKK